MTENGMIYLENIAEIGLYADGKARALIIAYTQGLLLGYVQGVKAAKEESTAQEAADKTDSADED